MLAAVRTGLDGIGAAAAEVVAPTHTADAAVRGLRATALETGRDLLARNIVARATADRLGLGAGRIRSSADVGARGRN
jgi:hypothetical protein